MIATLEDLNKAEEQADAVLAGKVAVEAQSILGRGTVAAVVAAVDQVSADRALAMDVRLVQVLSAVNSQLDNEELAAAGMASGAMSKALAAGYEQHLRGLAEIYSGDESHDQQVEAFVSPDDIQALRRVPILGRLQKDWTMAIAMQLRYEADGVVGQAATGGIGVDQLPAACMRVAEGHAARMRQLSTDAFLAGVAAAQSEWMAHHRRR